MKRFAGAVFLLLTLQLTAGIPQGQTNNSQSGYFYGRIADETGKPAVGVAVQALQYTIDSAGVKVFQQIRAVISNDRGEYRLFMLAPGRYYIVTGDVPSRPQEGRVEPGGASGQRSGKHYVFSYYPGVGDITQATTLEIVSGNGTLVDLKAVLQ